MATHTSALQPGGKAHYNLHEHAFTTLALFHRLFSVFLVRRWYLVGLVKLASKPGIRCEATIGEWGQCTGGKGGGRGSEAACTKISPPPSPVASNGQTMHQHPV